MSYGLIREYIVEVKHAELIAGSPFSHPFREEIVRCKDCKHRYNNQCGRCPDWFDIELDGFCAWGERE